MKLEIIKSGIPPGWACAIQIRDQTLRWETRIENRFPEIHQWLLETFGPGAVFNDQCGPYCVTSWSTIYFKNEQDALLTILKFQ